MFVVCWSGTVAVFSNELDWLLNPGIRGGISKEPVDWKKAYAIFSAHFPDASILNLSAPPKVGYTIHGYARDPDSGLFRFYMDPVTYNVKEKTTYLNVQRFFRSFHMSLFLEGKTNIFGVPLGFWVVTLMGLVLLASSVTGFLFYKKWKKGFFKLEVKKGWRRLWSDTHKLIGLWSVLFALIIGLTGFWYLMEFWLPRPPYADASELPELDKSSFLEIDKLQQIANNAYPELQVQRLAFYNFDKGRISFQGNDGSLLVRIRTAHVTLDAQTGKVLELQKPGQLSMYLRWWETVDSIHFGKFGGFWSKVLWFLFGAGLSTLCLTGAYLQAKRQQMKSGFKRYRFLVLLSYLSTIGILIFSSIWGIHEIKGYGTDGAWPEVPLSVTLFIGLWILSTVVALSIWMKAVR